MDMDKKIAYVCGPLTELPDEEKVTTKNFYSKIGDVCEKATGLRAFVPHEHFDPIAFAHFTPQEVDKAERDQVCNKTSILIVVAIAPSWGGGIEVEMAYRSKVPVIVIYKNDKKVSRLLRGNPAVVEIITYETQEEVLKILEDKLKKYETVS